MATCGHAKLWSVPSMTWSDAMFGGKAATSRWVSAGGTISSWDAAITSVGQVTLGAYRHDS
jgi:hypothetical protein